MVETFEEIPRKVIAPNAPSAQLTHRLDGQQPCLIADERSFWTKIGAACPHKTGAGLTMDAMRVEKVVHTSKPPPP